MGMTAERSHSSGARRLLLMTALSIAIACRLGAQSPVNLQGRWTASFDLDQRYRHSGYRPVVGDLTIGNRTATKPDEEPWAPAFLNLAFDSLLGRRLNNGLPKPGDTVKVFIKGDSVLAGFSPFRCFDCGFGMWGRMRGDTVRGHWVEQGIGAITRGPFMLVRRN